MAQLLQTVAQTLSEDTAGSDGVERLDGLVGFAAGVLLRIKPGKNAAFAESHVGLVRHTDCIVDPQEGARCRNAENSDESFVMRTGHEQHAHGDRAHNDRGTQVIRDLPDQDSNAAREQDRPYETEKGIDLPAQVLDQTSGQRDDGNFGDLRRLDRNT